MSLLTKIILKPGKAKPFYSGEQLVFSGAIAKIVGRVEPAELVAVYDAAEKFIGYGVYNPHSLYRVRMLAFVSDAIEPDIAKIIEYRLNKALAYRQSLGLPNAQTNAYRLCNSEGDGLSGVTIDVFDQHAVISVTAYWAEQNRDLIIEKTQRLMGIRKVHWCSQTRALAQDGWQETKHEVMPSEMVIIKEHGLQYQIDLELGQKTGFYCDQRDNRLMLRHYVKDKNVLDCFCYSGGFALNAAYAGAKTVLGIDSSKAAIELAHHNAALNQLSNVQFMCAKAESELAKAEGYEVIILDPPKLAPSRKCLARASQRYIRLNQLAIKALPKHGLLLTCSCSDALNKTQFIKILGVAAKKAHRQIKILSVTGAGKDHVTSKNARYGNYLKVILLEVL